MSNANGMKVYWLSEYDFLCLALFFLLSSSLVAKNFTFKVDKWDNLVQTQSPAYIMQMSYQLSYAQQ
jgi:hypothetical protein